MYAWVDTSRSKLHELIPPILLRDGRRRLQRAGVGCSSSAARAGACFRTSFWHTTLIQYTLSYFEFLVPVLLEYEKFVKDLKMQEKQENVQRTLRQQEFKRLQTLSRIEDADLRYEEIQGRKSKQLAVRLPCILIDTVCSSVRLIVNTFA